MTVSAPKPSSASEGFFQVTPIVLPAYTSAAAAAAASSSSQAAPTDDPILPRITSLYLPQPTPQYIDQHLHNLSRLALHETTLEHCTLADNSPPTLSPYTTFGAPNQTSSQLQTSPSWQYLKALQTSQGIITNGYPSSQQDDTVTAHNPRIYQFLLSHIFDPSSALVSCPAAMTDGAAKLLSSQLNTASDANTNATSNDLNPDSLRHRVFQEAYRRLTSSDPNYAWTAGQWMTERSGGSDVAGTETIATLLLDSSQATTTTTATTAMDLDAIGLPLGPWSVSGFKWFSSATDANCAILLAKTASKPNGELSCFFAPLHRRPPLPPAGRQQTNPTRMPTRRQSTTPTASPSTASKAVYQTQSPQPVSHRPPPPPPPPPPSSQPSPLLMNGIQLTRLKRKLGTRALPTAELQLNNTRAWLIGTEGQGVKAISTVLNITRLHTAKGAIAGWGRGLAVARAWTRVRHVKDVTTNTSTTATRGRDNNNRGGRVKKTKVPLAQNKQHVRWMAQETVKYRAHAALCYFGVALLGVSERMHLLVDDQGDKHRHGTSPSNTPPTATTTTTTTTKATRAQQLGLFPPTKRSIDALLRIVTPLAKSSCSLAAVHGLRECMECLGGVGYCENDDAAGDVPVSVPVPKTMLTSTPVPMPTPIPVCVAAALAAGEDEIDDAEEEVEPPFTHAHTHAQPGVLNIARLWRDAAVNPIWEGTGSVLAEDLLRALGVGGKTSRPAPLPAPPSLSPPSSNGTNNHQQQPLQPIDAILRPWLHATLDAPLVSRVVFPRETQLVWKLYGELRDMLLASSSSSSSTNKVDEEQQQQEEENEERLSWQGRALTKRFTHLFCAVLLMVDAVSDADPDPDPDANTNKTKTKPTNEVAVAVARRWVRMTMAVTTIAGDEGSATEGQVRMSRQEWLAEVEMDRRIFLGDDEEEAEEEEVGNVAAGSGSAWKL